MSDPHFKIGDQVQVQEAPPSSPADAFVEAFLLTNMLGIYEVTSILPDAGSEAQYRLKGLPAVSNGLSGKVRLSLSSGCPNHGLNCVSNRRTSSMELALRRTLRRVFGKPGVG